MKRLVWVRVKQKQTRGRLFQRQLSVPKLFEFEDDFYTVMERVQSETKVINPDLVVREKFRIMRSTRKVQSGHAMNMQIDKDLIDARVTRPLDPILGIWLIAFPRILVYDGTQDSSPFEE
jgi:hypothetical protein